MRGFPAPPQACAQHASCCWLRTLLPQTERDVGGSPLAESSTAIKWQNGCVVVLSLTSRTSSCCFAASGMQFRSPFPFHFHPRSEGLQSIWKLVPPRRNSTGMGYSLRGIFTPLPATRMVPFMGTLPNSHPAERSGKNRLNTQQHHPQPLQWGMVQFCEFPWRSNLAASQLYFLFFHGGISISLSAAKITWKRKKRYIFVFFLFYKKKLLEEIVREKKEPLLCFKSLWNCCFSLYIYHLKDTTIVAPTACCTAFFPPFFKNHKLWGDQGN